MFYQQRLFLSQIRKEKLLGNSHYSVGSFTKTTRKKKEKLLYTKLAKGDHELFVEMFYNKTALVNCKILEILYCHFAEF